MTYHRDLALANQILKIFSHFLQVHIRRLPVCQWGNRERYGVMFNPRLCYLSMPRTPFSPYVLLARPGNENPYRADDVITLQQSITSPYVYFIRHSLHIPDPEFAQIDRLCYCQLLWSLCSETNCGALCAHLVRWFKAVITSMELIN